MCNKKGPLTLQSQTDHREIPFNQSISQNIQDMHPEVKRAFDNLCDELLLAMASDYTSIKDAEIYSHIITHITNLKTVYSDVLADKGR